jgi:hypothetical protein
MSSADPRWIELERRAKKLAIKKRGWPVPVDRVLANCVPVGYELREDTHFMFLYRGEQHVAQFSALTPLSDLVRAIAWEAQQHGNH